MASPAASILSSSPSHCPWPAQERLCYGDRPIVVVVLTADEGLPQCRGSRGREKLPHSAQKGLSQCLVVLLSFCTSPPSGQEDTESCGPGRDCGSVTCFLFLQLKEAQLIFIVETISLIEGHLFNVNKCRTPKSNRFHQPSARHSDGLPVITVPILQVGRLRSEVGEVKGALAQVIEQIIGRTWS